MLQPRVHGSAPNGRGGVSVSACVRELGGIDPYAAAMLDVYQDLFEEGSYTGKGIYAVDAFRNCLGWPNARLDAAQS